MIAAACGVNFKSLRTCPPVEAMAALQPCLTSFPMEHCLLAFEGKSVNIAAAHEIVLRQGWLCQTPPPFQREVLDRCHLTHFGAGQSVYSIGRPTRRHVRSGVRRA